MRNRFFHISKGSQYIWLAFAGAAATAVLVYGLASIGGNGATPIKLALAGAAAGTALQSLVNTVMLPNNQVMDQFRFWQTGNIGGASWTDIRLLAPYFVIGFVVRICISGPITRRNRCGTIRPTKLIGPASAVVDAQRSTPASDASALVSGTLSPRPVAASSPSANVFKGAAMQILTTKPTIKYGQRRRISAQFAPPTLTCTAKNET